MKERVLVLGAGNSLDHRLRVAESNEELAALGDKFGDNFKEVHTVDWDSSVGATFNFDLSSAYAWAKHIEPDHYDEIHAYEVLEHLHRQGDFMHFFSIWKSIWSALKPKGLVVATTPRWDSIATWGDPGHTAVYNELVLSYLSQDEYAKQVGKTAMSDYRRWFPPPFSFRARLVEYAEDGSGFRFCLEKEEWIAPSKD